MTRDVESVRALLPPCFQPRSGLCVDSDSFPRALNYEERLASFEALHHPFDRRTRTQHSEHRGAAACESRLFDSRNAKSRAKKFEITSTSSQHTLESVAEAKGIVNPQPLPANTLCES